MVWMGRVDLHAERGRVLRQTRPTRTVPLDRKTSIHIGEGGARLTIRNGDVEVRLVSRSGSTAEQKKRMSALCEVMQKASTGSDNADFDFALHPWNHCPRELPRATYNEICDWYCAGLRDNHSHIRDALSGKPLDVLRQCVAIDVESAADDELGRVKDASGLAGWLSAQRDARCDGADMDGTAAVLLTAGPAAGKTSLISQVVVYLLDSPGAEPLVPIIVKVQLLQVCRLLRSMPASTAPCLSEPFPPDRSGYVRMARASVQHGIGSMPSFATSMGPHQPSTACLGRRCSAGVRRCCLTAWMRVARSVVPSSDM